MNVGSAVVSIVPSIIAADTSTNGLGSIPSALIVKIPGISSSVVFFIVRNASLKLTNLHLVTSPGKTSTFSTLLIPSNVPLSHSALSNVHPGVKI